MKTIFLVVQGHPYKGNVLPKVGGGWKQYVGSDKYGGTIIEVANDLSWFKTEHEFVMFDYRKNSVHFGKYVFATKDEKGKNVFTKTSHSRGCTNMNVCYVCEEPQKNELDPGF